MAPDVSSGDRVILGGSLGSPVLGVNNGVRDRYQVTTARLLAVWPVGGVLRIDLAAPDISGSGPVEPGESIACGYVAASTCAIKHVVTGAAGAPPAGGPASGATSMVHAIARVGRQAWVGQASWLLIQRPGASRCTP